MQYGCLDLTRIHRFTVKGRHFVLDVNSCVFFEIDEVVSSILAELGEAAGEQELLQRLSHLYSASAISKGLADVRQMIETQGLFSDDNHSEEPAQARLSTLCLDVSQKCNLKCRYCFAQGGDYGQAEQLMSREVAERTVDFLIENSGNRKELSLSFFGGEPLLNLPVIKQTVRYARAAEAKHGTNFRFHITTNGTLLSQEVVDFIDETPMSMIVSLDGPKEVNDSMRVSANGKGSYDLVYDNLMRLLARGRKLTVRSTFTRQNLDVDNLAMHLFSIGCRDVSVEPCATEIEEFQFTEDDLEILKQRYDVLADRYLEELIAGKKISFFHLRQMIDQVGRRKFKLTQCGAGNGYLAVGADGRLYPCHKFVGNRDYVMGDVFSGISARGLQRTFHSAYVRNKPTCMGCWARYICGGGCHSHAITFNGNILEPYNRECVLMRHRIELGAYLHANLAELGMTSDGKDGRVPDVPSAANR